MNRNTMAAPLGAMGLLVASPAFSQEVGVGGVEEVGFILNSFMALVFGILIMFMAIGFAMLEAGFVRSKNVSMQLTKNIGIIVVASILFFLLGYNLMHPGDAWTINGVLGAFELAKLPAAGVDASELDLANKTAGSDFFFQLMFCAATASIVSGALAERIKLWPFLAFIAVLTGLIYPIQASWAWSGGFLAEYLGFVDFAGATIVHSVGGWAALAGAIVLGPRIGKYGPDGRINPIPASNLALAALGTLFLWVGWFGFNGGSLYYMNSGGAVSDMSRVIANTNMAAAGGAMMAFILTQLRFGTVDLTMILNGALAGLVAITAEPLMPNLGTAIAVGAVGGALVVTMVPLLERFGIDDVVGAISVHLCAGVWGTFAVIFTTSDASIFGQVVGILTVGGFVFVTSLVLWTLLAVIFGIRASRESEEAGLDLAELGMEAYPEFAVQR
ncbi:MAG: ammonium transporter [Paracoccaceae bacterium]